MIFFDYDFTALDPVDSEAVAIQDIQIQIVRRRKKSLELTSSAPEIKGLTETSRKTFEILGGLYIAPNPNKRHLEKAPNLTMPPKKPKEKAKGFHALPQTNVPQIPQHNHCML